MKAKLLIIIIALASTSVFAQDKLADKFYKNYAYIKASELYEKAVEKGDSSAHVLTRLGDCYYNNSNSEKAAKWYGLAVEKYDDIDALVLFKYIQTLQSLGQYEEANNYRIAYNQRVEKKVAPGFDELMSFFQLNTDTERVYVDVQNSEFNSSYSDFGGYTANGKMYIASARPNEATAGDKIYKWNEQPFLDIYEVPVKEVDGKTAFGAMAPISAEDVNTPYHEGTVAVTADGKKIFFTRDNVTRRKKLDYDKSGTTHLKIYKASIDNDSWSDIEELPFNSEAHSIGHPALSPDNKRLYFVSDMDGGFGATDLYYVDITEEDGEITYSAPVNMGPKINTEGREMFPFIAKDSTLYFSNRIS